MAKSLHVYDTATGEIEVHHLHPDHTIEPRSIGHWTALLADNCTYDPELTIWESWGYVPVREISDDDQRILIARGDGKTWDAKQTLIAIYMEES